MVKNPQLQVFSLVLGVAERTKTFTVQIILQGRKKQYVSYNSVSIDLFFIEPQPQPSTK